MKKLLTAFALAAGVTTAVFVAVNRPQTKSTTETFDLPAASDDSVCAYAADDFLIVNAAPEKNNSGKFTGSVTVAKDCGLQTLNQFSIPVVSYVVFDLDGAAKENTGIPVFYKNDDLDIEFRDAVLADGSPALQISARLGRNALQQAQKSGGFALKLK